MIDNPTISAAYTVAQGGTLTLPILVISSAGAPTDPEELELVIYDPEGNEQQRIELGDMTRTALGRYEYALSVPADAALGDWIGSWDGIIIGADAIDVFVRIAVVPPGSLVVPGDLVAVVRTDRMRSLLMEAGADLVIDLQARDRATGQPLDLTDATLTFQVRRYVGGPLVLEATTEDGITHYPAQAGDDKGRASLEIRGDETAGLAGVYRWGLWLTDAFGNRQSLRERGAFFVARPVVKEEGGS